MADLNRLKDVQAETTITDAQLDWALRCYKSEVVSDAMDIIAAEGASLSDALGRARKGDWKQNQNQIKTIGAFSSV